MLGLLALATLNTLLRRYRLRARFSPLSNSEIDHTYFVRAQTKPQMRFHTWRIVIQVDTNRGAEYIYISLFHNGRGWCARRI